jgi:hypothetical protein
MTRQLWANIKTNLVYYRRNKLLVLIALFFLFIWALTSLPSLFFYSSHQKFQIIQMILQTSSGFIGVFMAAMGVLTVFHHLNGRSYKMVVTKPCLPEVWLLGNFLSAMLVSAVLYLLLLPLTVVLFLVWGIPFQGGVAFVLLDGLFRSAILYSALACLSVLIHPFLAVLAVLMFNEGTFYWLTFWMAAGAKAAKSLQSKMAFTATQYILYGIYLLLPSFAPYAEKTQKIYSSLKLTFFDLRYLGLNFLYTLLVCALFFIVSDVALRRKRLI